MAIYRLEDISNIQLGLILARKKADDNLSYAYKQLTLRSMEEDRINHESTIFFHSKTPLSDEYLSKVGTIVMKLFSPFNPVIITSETEGYLIPSQMVSITPKKQVLPEYLQLYLSQDFVAEKLLVNYFVIAQRAITVESLSKLEIRVPSMKNQQIICEYYQNYRQLRRLRKELGKKEDAMMKYVFSKMSNEKGDKK